MICGCGKRGYLSKSDAKAVLKKWHRGEGMQVYACDQNDFGGRYFHLGHRYGMTRDQHRAIHA